MPVNYDCMQSRLILLNPRLFKKLKSYVNKELRFYRNLGVQSSRDYLTGLI